jgi:hypothetical protein
MTYRAIPMSAARFTRMWREGVPSREIMREFGIAKDTCTAWAKSLGLPARKGGSQPTERAAEIVALYRFGVEINAIAAAAGVERSTVMRVLRRSGEPLRGKGHRSRLMAAGAVSPTVEEYRAAQLAEAMAKDAATTQAALRSAGMVDRTWARKAA